MLTAQQSLHLANEWTADQINDFARRIVACQIAADRQTIMREFNVSVPAYNQHPQIVALLNACRTANVTAAS